MPEAKERNTAQSQKSAKKKQLTGKLCENMSYASREAFKRLRTNIMIALPQEEKQCKIIGITSAQPSEGKSTVAINMAYSLAELGKYVILIDGDMRRPSLHDKLDIQAPIGLSELLQGNDKLDAAVVRYKGEKTNVHFEVLTAGAIPDNPSELLTSARFQKILDAISSVCDYVIIDLPPVSAVVDAVGVSKLTDGIVVVVRENNCAQYILADCMDQLKYADANILGFVVNGSVEGAGKRYQYRYQYGR